MKTKIFIVLVILGLFTGAVTLTKPKPHQAPAQTTTQSSMLEQINEVRAKAGKKPLAEDPKLDVAAQRKVEDQIARNYWAHHLDGESTFQFYDTEYIHKGRGENIAKCQLNDTQTIKEWVASPSHYAAMTGDFDAIGIAKKVNPKDGCTYTVNEFIKY